MWEGFQGISWADPRKRATSSWSPLPGGGRAPGASPGQRASSGLLLSTLTFPSRLLRAVDGFPFLRISQHPERRGHAAPDSEYQRQLSKLAQVGKGGPWAHPASRGEPRLGPHPPPPAYQCSRLRKGTAQGVRPRTGRRPVAPGHIYLKASWPWQSFLLKVKIPFVCGKKPHKKKKKKRKAQPKSTLVSIYNWGEGISHRFSSYMKKEPITQRRMCFPFPMSANFLGHRSAIWRLLHWKMISLSRMLEEVWPARLGVSLFSGPLSAYMHKDSCPLTHQLLNSHLLRTLPGTLSLLTGSAQPQSRGDGWKQSLFSSLAHR